ncbi:MAG: hypothetical protein WCV81_05720 [Microgenomates group bacterium]|jgi:hypothetical protein
MNDADIAKLAAKLMVSVATKEDLKSLATKEDIKMLEGRIDDLDTKLSKKINVLDKKIDIVLEYAQNIDETVHNHEKRLSEACDLMILRNIERIPVVAHELKLKVT